MLLGKPNPACPLCGGSGYVLNKTGVTKFSQEELKIIDRNFPDPATHP